MNQGKLDVVKQEMARVNINILGLSELKWTGMGEFNSDDQHIYYCGQEILRWNGVALIVNKRVWNAVPGRNLKRYLKISKDLFKKIGDTKGTIHAGMEIFINENGKDLTEAEEIKKTWQKLHRRTTQKDLNDLDNHDGVVTHLDLWSQPGLRKHY